MFTLLEKQTKEMGKFWFLYFKIKLIPNKSQLISHDLKKVMGWLLCKYAIFLQEQDKIGVNLIPRLVTEYNNERP